MRVNVLEEATPLIVILTSTENWDPWPTEDPIIDADGESNTSQLIELPST